MGRHAEDLDQGAVPKKAAEGLRHGGVSSEGDSRDGSLCREAEDGRHRAGERHLPAAQGVDLQGIRVQCREVGGYLFVIHRGFLQSALLETFLLSTIFNSLGYRFTQLLYHYRNPYFLI